MNTAKSYTDAISRNRLINLKENRFYFDQPFKFTIFHLQISLFPGLNINISTHLNCKTVALPVRLFYLFPGEN